MLDQTQNKIAYTISGSSSDGYAFPYPLVSPEDDLHLFVRDEETGKAEELLDGFAILPKDSYEDGCEVRLTADTSAANEGKTLILLRRLKLWQTMAIPLYGRIHPEELEKCLDRFVMITQQLQEQISRSMQIPLGENADLDKAYHDFTEVVRNASSWIDRAEGAASEAEASADKAASSQEQVDAVASQIQELEIGTVQAGESPAVTLRDGHILDFTLQKGPKGDDGGTVVVPTKWGAITGTLSDQSDLASVLASKADASHDHDDTYVKKGEIPSVTEGTVPWGAITGSLADQIDLSAAIEAKADAEQVQSALDSKANSSHSHVIEDVAGIASVLASKANSSHSHSISDISTLQSSLEGKAAKSHTHVSSDITDLQTGGGVEEFSDASREWTAEDVGKIFKYTGETTGRFVNGRLYAGIGYKVIVPGGGTTYVLERSSGSDSYVAGAIGTYSLISGTEGSTDAVYKNGNGWIIYFNTANYRWALSSDSSNKSREDFINMTGIEGDKWTSWDYECNDSIFVTKVSEGSSTEEDAYTASLLDICPSIEEKLSGATVTIYPGRRYTITLSEATTLNADGGLDGLRGECEIDITTGDYSIVAGTNISLVDSLFANVVNRCVVRWDGTSAKLYVWEAR